MRLPWLVTVLLGTLALGAMRGEASLGEVWHLAASGAVVTVFTVLLALSFGLLTLKPKEPGA